MKKFLNSLLSRKFLVALSAFIASLAAHKIALASGTAAVYVVGQAIVDAFAAEPK